MVPGSNPGGVTTTKAYRINDIAATLQCDNLAFAAYYADYYASQAFSRLQLAHLVMKYRGPPAEQCRQEMEPRAGCELAGVVAPLVKSEYMSNLPQEPESPAEKLKRHFNEAQELQQYENYRQMLAEADGVLDHHRYVFGDPARFFLDEWSDPASIGELEAFPDQWIAVANLWLESLGAWASRYGEPRLLQHQDKAFADAQFEGAEHRPRLYGVIEIGHQQIETSLNPVELIASLPDGITVRPGEHVRNIAKQFADEWAITDGNEIAALVLQAKLGRTVVVALALASGPEFPFKLTGETVFHITGNPENADLDTYVKRVRQWVAAMAGIVIRSAGGQLATFETLQDMQQGFAQYRDSLPEGARPTQAGFATAFGLTERAIRKRLETLGANWSEVARFE